MENNYVSCKDYTKLKKKELKEKINKYKKTPILVIFQLGNNPSSNSYISGKLKDCEEVGIKTILIKLSEYTKEEELINRIKYFNWDNDISGIIVQLPLPKQINYENIKNFINPNKDVDGFNDKSKFTPCTPKGIIDWLKYNNYSFEGKTACVIGRSDIVGKPLAKILLNENSSVIQCHSKSKNIENLLNNSDIVFTCIDKIEYFKNEFNKNQDIIDIGLGIGADGKLHGNIDKNFVEKLKKDNNHIIISGIGNVGLLTRLSLLENTYQAYLNQKM